MTADTRDAHSATELVEQYLLLLEERDAKIASLTAQLARCREALTQIKIICEAPHLDPSQVPSQVYTMETSRSYHAIKAAVVRALAPTTGDGR